MSNKTITQLAKEHQIKLHNGRHSIGKSKHNKRQKEVTCITCKRNMTVPYFENQPYYCYRCDEELESALR